MKKPRIYEKSSKIRKFKSVSVKVRSSTIPPAHNTRLAAPIFELYEFQLAASNIKIKRHDTQAWQSIVSG